jgi:Fe(3+) dicitrate transport protein
MGVEAYGSVDLAKLVKNNKPKFKTIVFANVSVIDARYIKSQEPGIDNNFVEMVPPIILRSGITVGTHKWSVSYQFNYTHEHFSDASNAVLTATAVEGIIPTYTVSDLSASWQISKHWRVEASCNNLLNEKYFTRRAESYPGPGIIPSDARSIFLTLQWTL